jgi:hypothetical protein
MRREGWVAAAVLTMAACAGAPKRSAVPVEAQGHFLAGEFASALAAFERVARETGDPSARLYAALCLIKLDRPREGVAALQQLSTAVQAPALTARIHLALTEAYAMSGDPVASLRAAQAAERAAERRSGLVPHDEMLFVVGCAYLRMGRAEGREMLRALVTGEPRSGLAAEAALRLEIAGYGVRIGEPLGPEDPAPEAAGVPCRLVRIHLQGITQVFALLDGIATYQQAHVLAGRLRRDGLTAEALP